MKKPGLKLRRGKPPFVPVSLGGGAIIRVRAATQTDLEEAGARARNDVMGLVAGSEAAATLACIFGEEFEALGDAAKISAAAARLAEVHLVLACQDGWDGVGVDDGTDDGTVIERPDAASVAMLLEDTGIRTAIMRVVNSAVHEVVAEKNGSAALPNGGAAILTGAPTADAPATAAPSEDTSEATSELGADAQRSRTRH